MAGMCDPIGAMQTKVAGLIESVRSAHNPEIGLGEFFKAQDEFFFPKELRERIYELIKTTDLEKFAQNVQKLVAQFRPYAEVVATPVAAPAPVLTLPKCDWPEYRKLVEAGRSFGLSEVEIGWIHPAEIGGERYIFIGELHGDKRFKKFLDIMLDLVRNKRAVAFLEGTIREEVCEQECLEMEDLPKGTKVYGLEERGVWTLLQCLQTYSSIEVAEKPLAVQLIMKDFLDLIYNCGAMGDVVAKFGEQKYVPASCSGLYSFLMNPDGRSTVEELSLKLVRSFSVEVVCKFFKNLALFEFMSKRMLFTGVEQTAIKNLIIKPTREVWDIFADLVLREKRNKIFARILLSPPEKLPPGVLRIAQMGYKHPEAVIQEMRLIVEAGKEKVETKEEKKKT